MVERVEYFKISSGRNIGFAVVFGSWPARVMKHRGWTTEKLMFSRVATPAEHETIKKSMRYQAMRYDNIEGLLKDEEHALAEWPEVYNRLTLALSR